MKTNDSKAFAICSNKGFHLTLPNGLVVSTQFGGGNYCDNRRNEICSTLTKGEASNNVEVAFFWYGADRNWATCEVFKAARIKSPNDDVAGYVTMKQWLRLLKAAQSLRQPTK